MNGDWGGSGARGARASIQTTFPHAQTCPRCPTIAQVQFWENRKFSISKFSVVRFGPALPFLGPSCVQSSTMGGTLRILQNLPEINVFLVPAFQASGKRVRRTRGGPGALPRCPLPTQHPLRHQKHPKSLKIIKKHQKLPKITQNHQNFPKLVLKFCHASKIQF